MATVNDIEKAIEEHVKERADNEMLFTTGWVLVASLSSPSYDGNNQDTYITIRSEGLPYHSMVGLLSTGVEINGLDMSVFGDDV